MIGRRPWVEPRLEQIEEAVFIAILRHLGKVADGR